MPLPKRKFSKARTRKRRANHYLRVPHFARCAKCEQPILPHTICPNCGFYSGRLRAVVLEKEPG
ncbi:MAG: 50S ribosomal protein L32 [Planctomycetes bacterium]|nr:50S ribosomal protein L32 [Planctomycetota bacterium]